MNKLYAWSLKLNDSVTSTLDKISGAADSTSSRFGKLQDRMSASTSGLGGFKSALMGIVAGVSLGAIGSQIFEATTQAENFSVAMETMLGNKEKASQLIADVTKLAAETPFELSDIKKSTQLLTAFGIESTKIKGTLTALGDVSAGIGAPIAEIAELYGKAKVQGRLFAEDMNQFQGRGIPIVQTLAKQFGVAQDKIRDMVQKGQIGFNELQKAFASLSSSGGMFSGMMEKMSKTVSGQFSNLKDQTTQLFVSIGNDARPYIMSFISTMSAFMSWFGKHWATIKEVIYSLVTALKIVIPILAILNAETIMLTVAQWALNVAMMANPYYLLVAAIVGVVAAVVALWNNMEDFRGFLYGFWASVKQIFTGIGDLASAVFGGLGKMIEGVFTFDTDKIKSGFDSLKDGIKKYGREIGSAYQSEWAKGAAEVSIRNKTQDDLTKGSDKTATSKVPPGAAEAGKTPGTSAALKNGSSGITDGTKQVRNVTVNINKLIEKFQISTNNLSMSENEIKRFIEDTIVRSVSGAEIALSGG